MSPRPRSFYIQKELYTGRAAPEGDPARREGGLGSDATEHVIVRAHIVVPHEQVASEGLVVEIL